MSSVLNYLLIIFTVNSLENRKKNIHLQQLANMPGMSYNKNLKRQLCTTSGKFYGDLYEKFETIIAPFPAAASAREICPA